MLLTLKTKKLFLFRQLIKLNLFFIHYRANVKENKLQAYQKLREKWD